MNSKPLILEVRANEYTLRGANPRIPYTADEIVQDAIECARAGAAVYHFHARQADGTPDHRLETYRSIISRIRKHADILVHPTLGAIALKGTAQERLSNVEALCVDPATRPDIAPLDMGSTNADIRDVRTGHLITEDLVYTNTTGTLKHFARRIPELGLKPYVMTWSVIYTRQVEAFLAMGLIAEPVYLSINLAEGHSIAGHPGTPRGLQAMLDFFPPDVRIEWTACVHGGSVLPLLELICRSGGHLSVGLGDAPYEDLGHPGNAALVRALGERTAALDRPLATPEQARRLLDIH